MLSEKFAEIAKELAKPFDPNVVQWRAGATNRDKTRAMALAYVDVRHYMERLDEVAPGWQSEVQPVGNGQVLVRLTVAGVTRTDVGEADPNDANTLTSAFAQAFKRACSQFGLGRYLYRIPKVWCEYDAQRKTLVETPALPKWAIPEGANYIPPMSQDEVERVARDRGLPTTQPTQPRRSNGNGDPATVVIKFGKYRGKTLGEILAEDKGYLEWLAEKSTNEFIASKARTLLETAQAEPDPEPTEEKVADLPVAAAPEPAKVNGGNGNGNGAGAPPPPPEPDYFDDIPF